MDAVAGAAVGFGKISSTFPMASSCTTRSQARSSKVDSQQCAALATSEFRCVTLVDSHWKRFSLCVGTSAGTATSSGFLPAASCAQVSSMAQEPYMYSLRNTPLILAKVA